MSPHDQHRRKSPGLNRGWLTATGVAATAGLIWFAVAHTGGEATRKRDAGGTAALAVEVITPQHGAKTHEIVLPGNIQAYYEAPIYARVNGYLKMWYQDIGAHVKAGPLLAEIDTPDLDQQLQQAQADLVKAKADEDLAAITAQRWQALVGSNSVSQQETDEKTGDLDAKKAAREAAEANVQRLQALEGFKRIVAPFDGIVTARTTDVGALIDAGSGIGPELFAVADVHTMRIYVRIPQVDTAGLHVGMRASLYLPERPGKTFPATITNMAEAINDTSRTMLVELQADNPKGELHRGTYTEVHFELPTDPTAVYVPISAILFQKHGLQVAVVGPDNRVVLKSVRIGRDYGTKEEIVSGLSPEDQVINSPPDMIEAGELVRVVQDGGDASPKGSAEPQKVGANQ